MRGWPFVLTLLAGSACGDALDERSSTPPTEVRVRGLDDVAARMLAHVPDDTPFVWLNAEPLPQGYVERIEPLAEASLAAWGRALEQPSASDDPQLRVLAESLRGHMTPDGLRELGFETNPRAVLYGLGLAPVLRVELRDGKRIARLLERIDAADGRIDVRTIEGTPVWTTGARHGSVAAAVAVVGDELVVTAYPPSVEAELLPRAIGAVAPMRSLAHTEWLKTARRDHELLPHGVGTIDFARIVAIASGEGDELTRAVSQAWSVRTDGEDCDDALRHWAARAPRLWLGVREIGARRIETAAIWELDEALRDDLRGLAAPIAGLGRSRRDEGLAALAVGIDFAAAVTLFERWRHDDSLQGCRALASQSTSPNAPAWLVGLHGGSAVLHEWDPLRSRTDGVLVLGVDDPETWLGLVLPSARQEALRRGRAVRASEVLPVGTSALAREGWIARGRDALGIATGDDARRHLRRAIDRERDDHHTLVSWSLDIEELLARLPRASLREALVDGSDLQRAWVEALLAKVERSEGTLAIGDHGLELGAALELGR